MLFVTHNAMMLKPRHLAAVQSSVLSTFLVAAWRELLLPPERALGQLEFLFAEGHEQRTFFIVFALATAAALLLAVAYWLPRSTSMPFSIVLPFVSVGAFALAVWQFDFTWILGFGLGCGLVLWASYLPGAALIDRRADKRSAG